MKSLKGKVVVITGASSGIGELIAYRVAENGGTPVLLARSVERMKKATNEMNERFNTSAFFFPLDVSQPNDVQNVFNQIYDKYHFIDILINNAGFGVFQELQNADYKDIQSMFNVNVLGLIACTKQVVPKMIEANKGHIINIASQAGKMATPKSTGYSATKHAVLGFTNSLRMELKKENIYVSAVNPGPIRTPFFDIADKSGNYVKNIEKFILDPEDVAGKIVKLMIHPKREVNIPWWMNSGSVLYQLFPGIVEKLAGNLFSKK